MAACVYATDHPPARKTASGAPIARALRRVGLCLSGSGGVSMKNGGGFYETCILTYPDVSCVYPDVSSRILYPARILMYPVRILCEPLYSGQNTFFTLYPDVS